jgi:8-oxo-dGTP pyrophosphatase MutT (NUDIX family)
MLVIKRKGERFTVRAAGVCVRDGHVLLQTEEQIDFWVLPGGRGEIGEQTAATVQREMREETELEVTVGELLWVLENFFTYYGGKAFHELGFYYRMMLPEDFPSPKDQPEFSGAEGDKPLTFRWFPLDEVANVHILPAYFRHALRELPTSPVHVVHRDVDE